MLQRTLDDLIDRGIISSRDVDSRIMDALEGGRSCLLLDACSKSSLRCMSRYIASLGTGLLADLGDGGAANAVQRFSEANFSRINNKNGFFMVRAAGVHAQCCFRALCSC